MMAEGFMEAECVFKRLESMRVKICLDDDDRKAAMAEIIEVVKKFKKCYRTYVVVHISYAVLRALFISNSTVVNDETIRKCFEEKEEEEAEQSEDDDVDEKEDEEVVVDWEQFVSDEYKASQSREHDASFVEDEDVRMAEAEQDMMEFAGAGIEELEEQCRLMGCSLKQGQERQILHRLVSMFCKVGLRFHEDENMKNNIELIMPRVRSYMARSCTLDNLQTVYDALDYVELDFRSAEINYYQVDDQLLNENTAPTNVEGITIPVNQFKQEKSDQTEECANVVTFLKPEQEEENAVNVDAGLTPELEDMKIGERTSQKREESTSETRKRKLEELSQPVLV